MALFENYEESPLLDSFVVKVKDISSLEETTLKIKEMDRIESASYGEETVDTIVTVFLRITFGFVEPFKAYQ